MVAHH
jgi:hypothetical protein